MPQTLQNGGAEIRWKASPYLEVGGNYEKLAAGN